jgi:hypothetical protein
MIRLLLASFLFMGAAPAAPSQAGREAEVIAALERARVAMEAWNAELEQGVAVDAGTAARLQASLQSLGEESQRLFGRLRASEPARPAGPAAQATPSASVGPAREISRVWVDDARAIGEGSAQRKERALASIREALTSGDGVREWAALMTLASIGDVEYDKAAFRPLVLPLARDAEGGVLVSAFYALQNTERTDGDLALLHAAWDTRRSPDLERSMSHLLFLFGGGRIGGRSEDIVLDLLGDERTQHEGLRGIWGAAVGERLAARLIELSGSTDHELRHDAIYFGLSTLQDKSEPVLDVLIAKLTDPDHNNSGRALWGLGHGVPEEQQARVAAALADLYRARSDPGTRRDCRRLVERYGGAEMAAALER